MNWLIAHAPYFGVGFICYVAGLVRAAYVELRREKLEMWLKFQRLLNEEVRREES